MSTLRTKKLTELERLTGRASSNSLVLVHDAVANYDKVMYYSDFAAGIQGLPGAQGVAGVGVQGAQGVSGSQGVQGTRGLVGAQGVTGTQGLAGSSTNMALSSAITTNIAVGRLASGQVIPAGTTFPQFVNLLTSASPDPGVITGNVYFGALWIGSTPPPSPSYANVVSNGTLLTSTASISSVAYGSRGNPQEFVISIPALNAGVGFIIAAPSAAAAPTVTHYDAFAGAFVPSHIVNQDNITVSSASYKIYQLALTSGGQSSFGGPVTITFRFTIT